jgi:chemosensory pili system protein ChpA (sensor histidine kinase/response regulator)
MRWKRKTSAMDNHDVVALYVAEMHALLPVVQRHLETLGRADAEAQYGLAARAATRVATALADLSSGFHVEDCAQLARAIAQTFSTADGDETPVLPTAAVLAAATDMVTYITRRIDAMADPPRLLAPTDADRAAALRLLAALAATRPSGAPSATPGADELLPARSGSGEVATPDDRAMPEGAGAPSPSHVSASDAYPGDDALNEDELALVRSFQSRPLRQTQAPVPATPTSAPKQHAAGSPRPEEPPAASYMPDTTGAPGDPAATAELGARVASRTPSASELDTIPPEMQRLFVVETSEDLHDLRTLLLQYEEQQDNHGSLLAMGRISHKIKGAAGTLGFDVLASLAFTFEDLLTALQTRQVAPGPHAVSILVRGLALMQAALDAANSDHDPDPSLIARAQDLRDEFLARRYTHPPLPRAADVNDTSVRAGLNDSGARTPITHDGESYLRVDVRRLDELMSHASALAVNRAAVTQIREEVARFQAEMEGSLARLAELGVQINDLAPLMRETASWGAAALHAEAAQTAHVPARVARFAREDAATTEPAHAANRNGPRWDALELERYSDFDHALRVLTEVVADLGTTSRSLRTELTRFRQLGEEQADLLNHMQRDVMQIRLVPLSTLMPRLQLEVRQLASQLGKHITFSVRGELTEIDRNISEQLTEPLIQLVRNALVHGIERPEERVAQGKPAEGAIWLHAYYVGSEVIIEVGDDGNGVNPNLLVARAVAAEVLDADTARSLGPNEALDLMFWPRVTLFESAQMLSGRGMGLDEVRTIIQRLKGSVHVRSEHGRGLVFTIRVPISLSIVRALRVGAGGQQFAVPFSAVQRTVTLTETNLVGPESPLLADGWQGRFERRIRIERERSQAAPDEPAYDEIPLVSLAALLGIEEGQRQLDMGLVVDAGRQRVALLVDDVLGDQEVVVQALPAHLRRRAVRGATVTSDGHVLLLLDLPELVSGMLEGTVVPRRRAARSTPLAVSTSAPRVLVVDDSISIRRALEQTLTRAGFEVELARDGIEALDRMLVSAPRVVVLDIEMPRLDGYELLTILRGTPQFADVPVVMLTSRAAEKHREHALQLGARAYLVKPCPQDTLIATVRGLLEELPSPA